jgi:hypothetical protein
MLVLAIVLVLPVMLLLLLVLSPPIDCHWLLQ